MFSTGRLLTLLLAVTGAAVDAQSVTTAVAVGPLGVRASATVTTSGSTTTSSNSLPSGMVLTPPTAQVNASLAASATSTTTVFMPASAGSDSGVTLGFQTYALSSPPASYSSASGSADVIIDYAVPASFAGWLHVTGNADFFTFGAQYAIDIGDDGTVELQQAILPSLDTSVPIAFAANGLRVRIAAVSGSAPSGRNGGANVRVELVPRVRVDPFGTPCGHALTGAWSATPSTDAIALQVIAAPANRLGLLGFGTQQIAVPITLSGCLLLVNPLVVLPFVTDATGSYTFATVIAPIPGLDLLVQSAVTTTSATGFEQTSNGLELRSP